MRVSWLEISNFRSIKYLRLEGLDKPQVVIEGPNDVGKSNILHALDLILRGLPGKLRQQAGIQKPIPGEPYYHPLWLKNPQGLFREGQSQFGISIGMRFEPEDGTADWTPVADQIVTYHLRWSLAHESLAEPTLLLPEHLREDRKTLAAMAKVLASAFRLVTTERAPQRENLRFNRDAPWENLVRWEGHNLKQMLFFYKNSPDLEIQERFEQLRTAVRDPELGIGMINVSVSPNETLNVRTRLEGVEMDLDERGSGIQQLLTLLTLSLCHRGKILAIEEPEMNLSEPNQRLLWKKLREFSGKGGPLDQVFVTSHSRVFEEEAERLIVTRTLESGTQAKWAAPGPPKHAPEHEMLPVTRGGGVTMPSAMLEHLGIQEGKHLYLVSTKQGYKLLGPQGYANLLREEDSDAGSAG